VPVQKAHRAHAPGGFFPPSGLLGGLWACRKAPGRAGIRSRLLHPCRARRRAPAGRWFAGIFPLYVRSCCSPVAHPSGRSVSFRHFRFFCGLFRRVIYSPLRRAAFSSVAVSCPFCVVPLRLRRLPQRIRCGIDGGEFPGTSAAATVPGSLRASQ
jgi:hypothetical protein